MTGVDGRVVIVTGAGRGIGRAEALYLGNQGARVVVNDLGGAVDGSTRSDTPAEEVAALIRESGAQALADDSDVADFGEAQTLVERAVSTFGRLDAVVNNAGILRDRTIFNMDASEWDAVVRVHLRGHFCVTRWAAGYWRDTSKRDGGPVGGRLVHTTSESGLFGNFGQSNYDAAKAGIAGFSLAVARECARYGVTSNAIAPRAHTRMTSELLAADEGADDLQQRLDPAHVAPWVGFLCSADSGHISGQCFIVGGGNVQLLDTWRTVSEVAVDADDSLDAVEAASRALFEGQSADPVPFPDLLVSRPI